MIEQNILLTADSAVFYIGTKITEILLVKRKSHPFKGKWALPGGFLEDDEALEAGAKRELEEETGLVLEIENFNQIGAFGAPDRDPRGRTVTVAFWAKVTVRPEVKGADDAEEAGWFPIDQLPELAFDHNQIIQAAIAEALPEAS